MTWLRKIIPVLFASCVLFGCGRVTITQNTQEDILLATDQYSFMIGEQFIKDGGFTAQEFMEVFSIKFPEAQFSSSDTDVVCTISVTDKENWIEFVETEIDNTQAELQEKDPSCRIVIRDGYEAFDIYYNNRIDKNDEKNAVIWTEWLLRLAQAVNRIEGDSVNINIYNSDTGHLVTSGNLNDGLSYDDVDWESSHYAQDEYNE